MQPLQSSFVPGAGGVASVFSHKPLQGSGGGIRRIFNINNNSKKNFVPDLFQEQLQPIKSSFVPGDEPLKYIDSEHSKQLAKQVEVQKTILSEGFAQTERTILKSSNTFIGDKQHIL